jgi:hypothetical protein
MSSSSQILVFQESDEPEFTEYKELLTETKRSKIYAGRYLCQDKIGDDFVNNAITDAAILCVNIFNENIIGFAAVSRYNDDHGNPYLYIDLICNSQPSLVTRKGQRQGAKAIIDRIEALARSEGCSSIKLSAVGDVIPYYYRLGYEFDTVYLKDGKSINETLKKEAHELITELRSAQIERSMKKQEKRFIKIIHRFFPGYLSEKYQSDVASKSGSARTGPASDQGIPMTKLLPRAGVEEGAAAREGGGRIDKKKTIRRKYKKQRGNKTRKYL